MAQAIFAVPDPELVDNGDMLNGHMNGVNGVEDGLSIINGNVDLERIKKKAKRPSKFPVKEVQRAKSDTHIFASLKALKNSRRSRNRYGRGLPKKGGAGGKGTWGALGSEITEEDGDNSLDANDPNYDDAVYDKDIKLKVIDLDVSKEDYAKKISVIILEYFCHGDTEDVQMSLREISSKERDIYSPLAVATAVEVAMDHKPSHREMTSVLLADLYGNFLREDDYVMGYDQLLSNLSDLILDTPDATAILGNFIARSIADDCIHPNFLQSHKGKISCELAVKSLARAEGLLSMRHGLVRLDNVWGVGGGTRPVKHLVNKMVLLLKEYLSSADTEEATRCLQDLEVPHFHHELVYEAVYIVLEEMTERAMKMMKNLIAALCRSLVITPSQMREGILRIYEDLPQISLDVPPAYALLERWIKMCVSENIVSKDLAKKMPVRGRKRFVSEGDGGKLKEDYSCF